MPSFCCVVCLQIFYESFCPSQILILIILTSVQEKGSDEIVFKAMGRAINKTVTIVELIKVLLVTRCHSFGPFVFSTCSYNPWCFIIIGREELSVCIRSHQLDPQVSLIHGSQLRKAFSRKNFLNHCRVLLHLFPPFHFL